VLLSFYLEKPGSAKNKKKEVFGDFYSEIFSPDKITADYSLVPHILSKEIDKKIIGFRQKVRQLYKENKDEEANKLQNEGDYLNYAQYYILYTVKLLAEKNDLVLSIENIKQIKLLIPEAQEIVKKLSKIKEKTTNLTLPYIFKSDDFKKDISNEIKK